MAYLIGTDTLFVHPPKTGGKAVLQALRLAGHRVRPVRSPGWHNGHATAEQCRDRRYTWACVFGFVRHPVAWWQSLRDFCNTPGGRAFDIDPKLKHPYRSILDDCREFRDADADTFVRAVAIDRNPGFYGSMLRGYYGDDFSGADWIGRQETLARDLAAFCRWRGLIVPAAVPPVNVSAPTFIRRVSVATAKQVENTEGDVVRQFYATRGTTDVAQGVRI